jgi:dTDP-4-amino-4,6-dideoxygalactose transaminase
METFSTMMLPGDLPPVGNMISLQARAGCLLENRLSGYKYWLDSGTSALAVALLDAKTHFPGLDKPRAIIPGYCCPDLIAACVYAGVEPVAVDININDPSYDLDQLRQHLDVSVIAVIAINFLGISERLDELQQLIAGLGLCTRLIEDNAQWFPSIEEEMDFKSDYVTFSFGRGKPMSLLGGGLLSARRPVAASVLACIEKTTRKQKLLALKIIAYNFLLTPQLYMLLNRNPWLRLGETKYVPLAQIAYMDDYRRSLLDSNFKLHSQRHDELPCSYDKALSSSGMQQLDSLCTLRRKRLLRYPLLCPDAVSRDNLLERMRAHGLGATSMYALPIDQIAGVNGLVIVPGLLKNANSFAMRFMTMPIHSGVSQAYQKRMWALIKG